MIDLEWYVALFFIILGLFFFFAAGLPIALGMGLVGFFGLFLLASPHIALETFGMMLYTAPVNFLLLAVPLFVLMAQIIIFTGIASDLYDSMEKLFAGFRAGLALASIGAGTAFAAVTGSGTANSATIGPVAMREMITRGYDKKLAAGSVAAAGGLAAIIPPSILFILYGYIAEVSVAKLFMAGLIPGLIMAAGYSAYVILLVKLKPSVAPPLPEPVGLKERLSPLIKIWPVVLLAALILGSMYGGVTTPTEAAAVGVLGALILSFIYRKFTLEKFYEAIKATAKTTSFVLLIVVTALMFGFLMSFLRIPWRFTEAAVANEFSPLLLLLSAVMGMLLLSTVMSGAPLILVIVPIVLPAMLQAGYDPIWLGVVLGIVVQMGETTPPVGMILFVITGVGKPYGVTFWDATAGAVPFLLADLLAVALVIAFPVLAMWIPNTMG
ncbi:MAG: TRAP transporter large permease [Dehalococcoidia bacterium]|jgi:tripartite ATP-independent transporter DctM subunit|nr:TRAP transporter large permease [Dehalococcoidia bacterium]